MQLKTCVHALLHSKKLYHINLMDSNLSLLHHSFIPGTLPEVTDYATSTNFLTLAGQLVNIINNASINNIPQLTLASGEIKGDCIGCLQNYATANFDNPSVSNLAPQYEWDISFYVTADYNVSGGGGGGGSSIDYSSILTNINTNLAALVSKNNQSEITQKLSDIFEYTLLNNSKISSMKAFTGNAFSSDEIERMNVVALLYKILSLLCNQNISWASSINSSMSIFKDIQKCIKYQVPANSSNDINENLVYIKNYINSINNKLSETVSNVDVPLLKEIALAISSLASANDNQAIKALKDTISTLELKADVNNVMQIDGTQEFRLRPFAKNYDDNDVEDI